MSENRILPVPTASRTQIAQELEELKQLWQDASPLARMLVRRGAHLEGDTQ